MSLSGRVAAITGGAGHLGTAMAESLAEMGAAIVLIDRRKDQCAAAAEQISACYGVATQSIHADLAHEEDIVRIPDAIDEKFHRLDILINCAAFVGTDGLTGWNTGLSSQSSETWRSCLEVNLTSAFLLTQKCVPYLEISGNGSVINILSIYGIVGPDWRLYEGTEMGNPAAYAASKGGLLQLTRWMSTTLAPNIRVNAITPGGISRGQTQSFQERYVAKVPLDRMAVEEDFKGAAAYLASDMSCYVTGQNLIVDGGWTAW
jgi:NAD(P)-dependent dehydrogenase (short-subunit alcohol dehydrogenase family)